MDYQIKKWPILPKVLKMRARKRTIWYVRVRKRTQKEIDKTRKHTICYVRARKLI
jgi:hypothetical protein